MKLSPAFLARKLKLAFPVLAAEDLPLLGTLALPVLYQPGSLLPADRVFLCTEEQLSSHSAPSAESSAFFLLCTETLPDELPASVSIAVKGSLSAVFSFLQELFWTYDSWQNRLMQARLDGKSIQHLLNLSLPVFSHPLMVVGMDFSIIAAASEDPSFFSEKVFGSQDETRPLLLALTESSEYASVRDLEGWFRFPEHVTGLGSLCVNITQHGQSAYRLLLLDTGKDLSDTEGFLLEFLAEMIQHAFMHNVMQKTSPAQSLHTVLLRALDDRTADYIAVSQALDTLGWYSRHTYCCLYLQLSDIDQKNLTANSVCAYLENILTGCSAFPHGGGIVAFFNLTLSDFSMADLMERMVHFVEDSSLNAGFSRCMNGHMNLRRQYIQAKIALQFGTRKYPDKRMHPFNDISFDYILDQATKKLPGYMLCHERLLFLQEHDDSSGSEYMRTLRCYLDNHCNVVQTARELFIHRSTLLYRLEKIKEILASDLSSPDEILYLMLSFRFIDLEQEEKDRSASSQPEKHR